YGSGYATTSVPGVVSATGIAFNGISLTTPSSGSFNLKISGIRAAANQMGRNGTQPVVASVSFILPLDQSQVAVAYPQTGLYATLSAAVITCLGPPPPSPPTRWRILFSPGPAFEPPRLTEGFGTAFLPKMGSDDTGTRFVITYSGFPSQTQLYVPDFVAGS